jgi:four helix bundle protein
MREPAKTFEDLIVWQKAHQFVLEVYQITGKFPQHEIYGLTSQFRRAAVSIAANNAEGFKKRGNADKRRFLNISHGSLEECRYFLILTRDLGYYEVTKSQDKLTEVSKLLEAYSKAILNNKP